MLFKDLLRLPIDKRTQTVPEGVLRRLRLPMPEDVFEQFICDHGVNSELQEQYGNLDLHALRWERVALPAEEIVACSVRLECTRYVDDRRKMALNVLETGWQSINLAPEAKKHWQAHRTWHRAPILIRGDLIRAAAALHLVEGHTRVGTLTGLIQCGWLLGESLHEIWIGSNADTPDTDRTWQQVLREESATRL